MILRLKLALLGAALVLPAQSFAIPVAIVNAGFEDLYLDSGLPPQFGGDVPVGAFPVGPAPSGWTIWDPDHALNNQAFVGVLNPGSPPASTFFTHGAPEGDNVALLYANGDTGGNRYGIEQTLSATLAANTTYRLTVQVGNIATGTGVTEPYASFGEYDLRGFPGYRIELWAGGNLLAFDQNGQSPGEGEFALASLTYASTSTDPLNQPLLIRLVNLNQPDIAGVSGLEVDFDDVRLDASATALPNPAPLALLAPGLAWLGFNGRRRAAGGSHSGHP